MEIPKLYKYRYFNEELTSKDGTAYGEEIPKWEQVLYDGIVFPSNPETFNDPYDCNFILNSDFIHWKLLRLIAIEAINKNFSYQLTESEKFEILKSNNEKRALEKAIKNREPFKYKLLTNEIYKSFEEVIKNIKTILKVACFSERKDSILMWSHYANNHTGFCIEYDFSKWELNDRIQQVKYTKHRHKMSEADFTGTISLSDLWKIIDNEVLYKSDEWEYEKEWRISFPWPKESKTFKYKNGQQPIYELKEYITGIYLGLCVEDDYKRKVCEHFKNTDIKIFQMTTKDEEYELIPEEIR